MNFWDDPDDPVFNRFDDWTDLYDTFGGSENICERSQGDSVYITADANLHFYHRFLKWKWSI